jgi:hypothetical protein
VTLLAVLLLSQVPAPLAGPQCCSGEASVLPPRGEHALWLGGGLGESAGVRGLARLGASLDFSLARRERLEDPASFFRGLKPAFLIGGWVQAETDFTSWTAEGGVELAFRGGRRWQNVAMRLGAGTRQSPAAALTLSATLTAGGYWLRELTESAMGCSTPVYDRPPDTLAQHVAVVRPFFTLRVAPASGRVSWFAGLELDPVGLLILAFSEDDRVW